MRMSSSWSSGSTYVPPRSKSYIYDWRTDSSVSYHSCDFCFPQERGPALHGDGGKSRRQPAAQHAVDYERRPWAPRRKYANVENEKRRKALREERGHTSRVDRGHTSRNTWAYERSRTGLQQRSPTKTTGLQQRSPTKTTGLQQWSLTKTNAREQARQQRDQGLTKRNVEQQDRGFAKHSVEQRDPGLTQRGGGEREQGPRHLHGVQWESQGARENRAPAEPSAWALNTHDLLWEIQDLRRENEDLRLRLHWLETLLVIWETIVDRRDKADVQQVPIMPKTLERSPEVGTQTPASRSRRWRR